MNIWVAQLRDGASQIASTKRKKSKTKKRTKTDSGVKKIEISNLKLAKNISLALVVVMS
jgi:hypothetical protein